jgi:DNA polymerase-1
MGMYAHVAEAVNKGDVLLESEGTGPPKPLLKNVFGTERKKAKVVGVGVGRGASSACVRVCVCACVRVCVCACVVAV